MSSRGRKRANRGARKTTKDKRNKSFAIARNPGVMVSDKVVVKLRYPVYKVVNSLASPSVAVRWYTDGLYDVDPTLGSTNIPGFAEWSAMYSYNRVRGYRVHFMVANLEAFPLSIYLTHTNTDPGTTGLNSAAQAQNRYGQTYLMASSNAQPAKKLAKTLSISQVLGDRLARTDQNFVGTATANPVDLTYVGVGASSPTAANLTNGFVIDGYIEFLAEFFDAKILTA
jgi:hypothetical protein